MDMDSFRLIIRLLVMNVVVNGRTPAAAASVSVSGISSAFAGKIAMHISIPAVG